MEKQHQEKPYEKLCIEINAGCNASCRWCTTGIRNAAGQFSDGYMSAKTFEQGINELLNRGLISHMAEIELYNWGEPLLNPELDEILRIICSYGLKYHISTNGSIYKEFEPEVCENMSLIGFSLSGMTEDSYGKIHKLCFKDVLSNIEATAQQFGKRNQIDKVKLFFHLYQFNICEWEMAYEFCKKLGIEFMPNFAYFNDYKLLNQFLTGKMDDDDWKDATEMLFLSEYRRNAKLVPANFHCPLWDMLVFDHKFNLLPCCRLTTDENMGNLFSLENAHIHDLKCKNEYCKECNILGQGYLIMNSSIEPKWYRNLFLDNKEKVIKFQNDIIEREHTIQENIVAIQNAKERLEEEETKVNQFKIELENLNLKNNEHLKEIVRLENNKAIIARQLNETQKSLDNIHGSRGYKALLKYYHMKDILKKIRNR